jgi:tetratricopeptide (TPR) repeat protein
MPENGLLQQAIAAARAGRELTARELFWRVVDSEPRNELAWMWLAGLLDHVDERIEACQAVLEINPANSSARKYLERLQKERQQEIEKEKWRQAELLEQVRELLAANKRDEAQAFLRGALRDLAKSAEAWRLLADLTPNLDEQTRALEKVLVLLPGDAQARQELRRLHYFQNNLFDLAKMYEEEGQFDKAISTYNRAGLQAKTNRQWDTIYWNVTRLENLKREKIVYISPRFSIARLTIGPALPYVMLMFIEVGVNPLAHPEPFLWLGALWALLGGFLIAVASVPSRHRLWHLLFDDPGSGGSPKARFAMAAAGWTLVVIPHFLLIADAYYRLRASLMFLLP